MNKHEPKKNGLVISEWTPPYHGVTHVKNTPRSHHISMTVFPNGKARCYMTHRHGLHPFSSIKEAFGSEASMRQKCDEWLNSVVWRS
jgi:hypothetical protein